jgi:hypothetical protein
MKLLPSTVRVLLKNADRIEQFVPHNTSASAMQVGYRRSKFYNNKNNNNNNKLEKVFQNGWMT